MTNLFKKYSDWKKNRRNSEGEFMSKQYVHCGDVNGQLYIYISQIPLFHISEDATDMKQGNVCISDAKLIIEQIRQSYIDEHNKTLS